MEGTRCGQYRITRKLAAGGMGEIYIATHELMGNEVVIKVLLPEMSANRDIAKRFFTEAQAAANLDSPGTVQVFDMGYADNGRVYIAMEKLRGEDLKKRLAAARILPPEQAARIVRQLARAIGAAHAQGIVHRDLKPENVFLVPDAEVKGGERIKVLDFGLAKLMESKGSLVTKSGAMFGTPAYMAPEQCLDAGNVDHRADMYAIGCIFYECLCGYPPFGHGGIELIASHLRDIPVAPRGRNPSLPALLDQLIMQLLAKEPGARPASCQVLVQALDSYLGGAASAVRTAVAQPASMAPAITHNPPNSGGYRATQAAATMPARATSSLSGAAGSMRRAEAPQRKSRWPLLALGAAVVVAGVVAAVVVGTSGGDVSSQSASSSPESPASPTVPPVGAGKVTTDENLEKALARARAAIEERRWADAEAGAGEVLKERPEHAEGKQILALAAREKSHQEQLAALQRAVAGRTLDGEAAEAAIAAYGAIAENSVYRQEADGLHDQARSRYTEGALARAKKLAAEHRCDDLGGLAERAGGLWPQAGKKLEAVTCRARGARTSGSPGHGGHDEPARDDKRDPPKKKPMKSYDQLMKAGKEAMLKNQYGKVRRLCDDALRVKPRDAAAATMCGMAACNMKKARLARKYHNMLSAQRKAMIRQQCLRAGLTDF